MIKEDLVSHKLALALKEKGFSNNNGEFECYYEYNNRDGDLRHKIRGCTQGQASSLAPTLSFVQKWLFETKLIVVFCVYTSNNCWHYVVDERLKIRPTPPYFQGGFYANFADCMEEALFEAVKIIK